MPKWGRRVKRREWEEQDRTQTATVWTTSHASYAWGYLEGNSITGRTDRYDLDVTADIVESAYLEEGADDA